jgi:DNA-directed RNA polymerase subunit RPC12/RpoP
MKKLTQTFEDNGNIINTTIEYFCSNCGIHVKTESDLKCIIEHVSMPTFAEIIPEHQEKEMISVPTASYLHYACLNCVEKLSEAISKKNKIYKNI